MMSEAEDTEESLDECIKNLLVGSFIEDGCIVGHCDDLETFYEIGRQLKKSGYSFSVRNSDIRQKSFSKKTKLKELDNDGSDSGQSMVFYHSRAIKFFGLPFTIEKTTNYQCTYGLKYYKSKAKQNKGNESQSLALPVKKRSTMKTSKKMGCLATMTLKKVIVYPDYPLDDVRDWRIKKKLIESLRNDLSTKGEEVSKFSRYFLSLSIQSRHNHPAFLHNYLLPRKKRISSDATPVVDEKIKRSDCENDADDSNNWVTLYSVPRVIEEAKEESNNDPLYQSLVTVKVVEDTKEEDEVRTYHFETIQCPSIQDLQSLFKEKLKRLYTISESCENTELMVQLLGDLEQTDAALINDIGYDPTL